MLARRFIVERTRRIREGRVAHMDHAEHADARAVQPADAVEIVAQAMGSEQGSRIAVLPPAAIRSTSSAHNASSNRSGRRRIISRTAAYLASTTALSRATPSADRGPRITAPAITSAPIPPASSSGRSVSVPSRIRRSPSPRSAGSGMSEWMSNRRGEPGEAGRDRRPYPISRVKLTRPITMRGGL